MEAGGFPVGGATDVAAHVSVSCRLKQRCRVRRPCAGLVRAVRHDRTIEVRPDRDEHGTSIVCGRSNGTGDVTVLELARTLRVDEHNGAGTEKCSDFVAFDWCRPRRTQWTAEPK